MMQLSSVRLLREELQVLQEPGSYVGEVVKVMGKKKVLVKVQPEGKFGGSSSSQHCIDLMRCTESSTSPPISLCPRSHQICVSPSVPTHTCSTRSCLTTSIPSSRS